MVTRRNPGYRDPGIREGLNNLAALFAPPSGAELAGFATAAAKREEAARIADLYARAGRANMSPEEMTALDQQMAVQAGGWQNSRWRFGQDDRRARDMNAADNTRALQQTQMQQTGETTRAMLAPVPQGGTRFVPPTIAQMYGVPGTQIGVIETKPGERSTLPDGRVIEGAPKPMSSDEVVAAALRDQLERGGVTPQAVIGPKLGTPVETQDEAGRRRFTAPGEAMLSGATPAPAAQQKPETFVAKRPDNTQITVNRTADGVFRDPQTGAPVDINGLELFNVPTPTGPGQQAGLGTNNNITEANRILANIAATENLLGIYEGIITRNPGAIGLVGAIRGTAQNLVASGSDLAKAFGGSVPQIQMAQNELREGLRRATGGIDMFDPSIPEAEFIQSTLAYALARAENGGTDVSNRDFLNALDRVRGGGLLANSDSARAAINASRRSLEAQRVRAETLRRPGAVAAPGEPPPAAPAAAPAQPAREEVWVRGPNGQLMRGQ